MGTNSRLPFRPWLQFSVRGFSILLFCFVTITQSSAAQIRHGVVLDASSGAPLAGVVIRIVPGGRVSLSGQNGEFEIATPDTIPCVAEFRRMGFTPVNLPFEPSDSAHVPLQVRLAETVYSVDPVVTTATREAASVDEVPFSMSAISSADLRMRNANDLGEVLESVPGILLQSYGGLGDIQTLSIRGSAANQVLILLDGQRLNTAQSGEIDLSTLPLESVQRIEVVRGGASAQYGADAMGGVVNIITGSAALAGAASLSAGTTLGSFGTRGAHLGGSFGAGMFSSSFGYRYLQSDNSYPYTGTDGKETPRMNADLLAHVLTGRVETRLDEEGGRILLNAEYLHQESGDPGSLTYPLARARKLTRNLLGNLTVEEPFGSHLLSVHTYLQVLRFGYTDPDSYIPTAADNRNTAAGFEANDNLVFSKRVTLTGGYSFRSDRYAGNSLSGEPSRTTNGLFVQSDIRPVGFDGTSSFSLSLFPAIRWDHSSDFGGSISPKFGVTASMGSAVRLAVKANAGKSFRAPTFNDLYWPFDGYTVGNPALSPETSTDFDAGFIVAVPNDAQIHAGLTYYTNNVRDLILWQAQSNGIWTPSNIGRALLHGFEAELSASPIPGLLRLTWTMTTIDAQNRTDDPTVSGKTLPYQPSATHKFSAGITRGPLDVILDLVSLSRRFINTANTASLPPVHTIDASVGYRFPVGSGDVRFIFTAKDLENVRYQLIDDYPLPGREIRLAIDYLAKL